MQKACEALTAALENELGTVATVQGRFAYGPLNALVCSIIYLRGQLKGSREMAEHLKQEVLSLRAQLYGTKV